MFRSLQRVFYLSNLLIDKNQNLLKTLRPFSFFVYNSFELRLCNSLPNKSFLVSDDQYRLFISRNKHKKAKSGHQKYREEDSSDEEEDEDIEDENEVEDKNVKTHSVKSMRIDLLLKTLLGISRKKIEDSFYENKIRINGKLVLKKSQSAKEGDEIDLIVGFDRSSPDTLKVGRVNIYKVTYDSESDRYMVKAQSFKSITIKNYSSGAAWREPEEQN